MSVLVQLPDGQKTHFVQMPDGVRNLHMQVPSAPKPLKGVTAADIFAKYDFEVSLGTVIKDSSGGGHDLTANGLVVHSKINPPRGKFFGAFTKGSYATAATDFIPPLGNFSVCAMYQTRATFGHAPLFFVTRGAGPEGSVAGISIGDIRAGAGPYDFAVGLEDGDGNAIFLRKAGFLGAPGANPWVAFVVMVQRDPQKITIYKDGIDVTTQFTVDTVGTGSVVGKSLAGQPVTMNNDPAHSFRTQDSYWDDVRFYGGLLTPQQAIDYTNGTLA